jgi:YggT family protein
MGATRPLAAGESGRYKGAKLSSSRIPLLMNAIIWLILTILDIYFWIVIAMAVLSWLIAFNVINTRNQVVSMVWDMLIRLTEPVLAPIRRVLPNFGGIDVSPVILLLAIGFLRRLIVELYVGMM